MNPMVCALFTLMLATQPGGGNDQQYSFSAGAGTFYALRHHKPGAAPYVEVIGSDIAMNRAKKQAREGGYTLDIKGPFGGHREALTFIREEWERCYGAPKKPMYGGTPLPHVTRSPVDVKAYLDSQ
ncbi:MAG: hypothetical protein WCP22_05450 [Chlamydiota bacterium]